MWLQGVTNNNYVHEAFVSVRCPMHLPTDTALLLAVILWFALCTRYACTSTIHPRSSVPGGIT